MEIPHLHDWSLTIPEATKLQRELASRVEQAPPLTDFHTVAGADISYNRFSPTLYAAVVVLDRADAKVLETQSVVSEATFPYQPGYLSFREAPVVLQAFAKLKTTPDVVMLDGQGIAHPRRLGLAAHLGLWLNLPTIGVAKSRLCGTYGELSPDAGSHVPLVDRGETVGCVLRTKKRTNPLYISPGHRIDLPSAIQAVLAMCRGYRIPEPTRQAHLTVNALRAENTVSTQRHRAHREDEKAE